MATGSASPILASKMPESGVGRWSLVKIPTLSFYEYIELLGIPMPEIQEGMKPTALAALKKEDLASLMVSLQPLQKHFHQKL
jgi:predicted AAA+ superfamily ATPase